MKRFYDYQVISSITVLIMAGVLISGGWTISFAHTVTFANEQLSVSADNEPLVPVLESIAREANLVIFMSKGFVPENLKVQVGSQPLEKALDRVLKGLNVIKIYHEQSGRPRLTAIKIYPTGKSAGPLDVVIQTSVPEPETPFSGSGGRYAALKTDVLQPQEYVRSVEYDTLVSTAMEFEKREEDSWSAIQTLKDQINDEVDETKNQVLSLALLDKYEAFEQMQKNHINTLEKMHRMEHFMESKANQDKQK